MPLPNPTYTINYSDPTKTPFTINAFATDGTIAPSSTVLESDAIAAHSSILLYGKGHPNYGQRTDQNLLNMVENFANKSRPAFPLEGQFWYKNANYLDPLYPLDPQFAGMYLYNGTSFLNVLVSGAMSGDLDMSGFKIINLGNPTNPNDATNKLYVDIGLAGKVNRSGDTMLGILSMGGFKLTDVATATVATDALNLGTADGRYLKLDASNDPMTGDLDMGGFKITSLGAPTPSSTDAATALYVDTGLALKVAKAGDTMTGTLIFSGVAGVQFTGTGQIDMNFNKIVNLQDPTSNQDAATKIYVDTATGGAGDTFVSSFTYTGGLASTAILNLTQTGPNDPGPFNISMAHIHITDDVFYLVPPNYDLDNYYRLFGASGYQRVTFSLAITNAGIPYTSNATRTATVTIDGTPYPLSVTVTSFATYTFFDLVTDINSQLSTFGVARVIDGDTWLSMVSKSTGTTSTVSIADVDLFSDITNFSAIAAAVPGYGNSLVANYPLIDTTTSIAGYDTVKVTTRPVEITPAFTLNPRSLTPEVSGTISAQTSIQIITADNGTNEFTVYGGNFAAGLYPGRDFDINDSLIGNNGSYTVLSTTFNDSNRICTITTVEDIPVSTSTPDGTITYPYEPIEEFDVVTKFWTNRLIARDVIEADGIATQYTIGHTLPTAGFDSGFGFQEVIFSLVNDEIDVTGATTTGLTAGTTYTATIFVDETPNAISFLGSAAATFATLITAINADLTGAEAELVNGRIRISSTLAGGGPDSTIVIVDSGTNFLFASLNNVAFDAFQFSLSQPGMEYTKGLNRLNIYVNGIKQTLDYDYTEDGIYGTPQTTFTFSYVVAVNAVIEFIVFRT